MKEQELLNAFACVHKTHNYPPIAGKILGLFFVSEHKHLTFEAIMNGTKSSKSATSKALKFLINLNEVSFIRSESNKRKRLFSLNIVASKSHLANIIEAHKMETKLLKKVLKKRTKHHVEMNELIKTTISFNEEVLNFISDKIKEHFDTKPKINRI